MEVCTLAMKSMLAPQNTAPTRAAACMSA
jgi:hypothetical protein